MNIFHIELSGNRRPDAVVAAAFEPTGKYQSPLTLVHITRRS